MTSADGLYRLMGSMGNHSIHLILLIVIILVMASIYYKNKKLLIGLIFTFISSSLFFYSAKLEIIYSDKNFSVLNDGSYIYINEVKNERLEYTRYSNRNKLIETGIYKNGELQSYLNPSFGYNYFLDAIILSILLIIVYIIVFLKDDYIKIRDYKRNIELTPFSYKTIEAKQKFLKENLYCNVCDSKVEMEIEKEVYSKGMHVLYMKCTSCNNETKHRIDL